MVSRRAGRLPPSLLGAVGRVWDSAFGTRWAPEMLTLELVDLLLDDVVRSRRKLDQLADRLNLEKGRLLAAEQAGASDE